MTEWVEGDWAAVSGGDPVQLRREGAAEDALIEDRARATYAEPHEWTVFGISRHTYERSGWSLFVEASPVPELPTEPGWYIDAHDCPWYIDGTEQAPRLRCARHQGECGSSQEPLTHAPFTRFEPVTETARKVLDRFASWWESGPPRDVVDELENVGREFGVTW